MFPMHGHMNSYPQSHHGNQMTPFLLPSYTTWEARAPPSIYEPFSCDGSFPYPRPGGCSGCCNHGCSPGCFNFRPLYPCVQHPCVNCNMFYTPYPDPSRSYFVPHSWHLPNHVGHHGDHPKSCCSGFPDHISHQKDDQDEKSGEGKPSDSKLGGSYPAIQFPSFPYPIVWLPTCNNKGMGEGSTNSPPQSWPAMTDRLVSREEESRKEKEMNACGRVEQSLPRISGIPEVVEENPSKIKIIPLKLVGKEHNDEQPCVGLEASRTKVLDKESKCRTIPVKEMESSGEKQCSVTLEKKENPPSCGNSGSRTSPVKSSRFTPVCLRVDPLPKRRAGSGSSRSPSPQGNKEKDEKEMKTNVSGDLRRDPEDSRKESSKATTTDSGCKITEGNSSPNEMAVEKPRESKEERLKIATTDAAISIQSAYRGFQVRKWEPLKKLRQIKRVREQIDDIKERIDRLRTFCTENQDGKEKVLIGETIMNLLLHLDTIQGLHPVVREIRKAVARELVDMQETLDLPPDRTEGVPTETVENHNYSTGVMENEEISSGEEGVLSNEEPTGEAVADPGLDDEGRSNCASSVGLALGEKNGDAPMERMLEILERVSSDDAVDNESFDVENLELKQESTEELKSDQHPSHCEIQEGDRFKEKDLHNIHLLEEEEPVQPSEDRSIGQSEVQEEQFAVEEQDGASLVEEEKVDPPMKKLHCMELLLSVKDESGATSTTFETQQEHGLNQDNQEPLDEDGHFIPLELSRGSVKDDIEDQKVSCAEQEQDSSKDQHLVNKSCGEVVGCERKQPSTDELVFDNPEDKVMVENDKLRTMLEKLLVAGDEQREVITVLNARVKDLEKKLAKKKRIKLKKCGGARPSLRRNLITDGGCDITCK